MILDYKHEKYSLKLINLYYLINYSYLNASAGDILDAFHAGNILANRVRVIDNPITTKTSLKFMFEGNVDKKYI